ncbi:hypothetical protein D3877_28345 [Azospirillum cavernae]|uniref:Phytanoyl-CoA dioxygenase n=1 Tax=Azospirillum cavernae TaxID=2320860 RepID=A0A418VKX1_9PROT|nr:phytanoyl-CoA dioxygenase family protein [Azospirillum cavernae]RJF76797.1 hypothetical protein D3877_28345 [Azospirillum cavernae]
MKKITVQEALEIARQHQNDGKIFESESIYKQILQIQPNNADANAGLFRLQKNKSNSRLPTKINLQAPTDPAATAVSATLTYLLFKLIFSPRDRAIHLFDQLRFDSRDASAESEGSENPEGIETIIPNIQAGILHLEEQRYDEALSEFRKSIVSFLDIVEQGKISQSLVIFQSVLDHVLKNTRCNTPDILALVASAVASLEKGTLEEFGHIARLRLYTQSDALFTDMLASLTNARRPPVETGRTGILGSINTPEIAKALAQTREEGYHLFEKRLPCDMVDRLVRMSLSVSATGIQADGTEKEMACVDFDDTGFDGFSIDAQTLLDDPDIQALMCDPSLFSFMQQHLGCEPICVGPVMRWSVPSDRTSPSDALAQLYHWDADAVKWLKIFLYLTDVDETSGPHVYIKGTHRPYAKPKDLLNRFYARISDEDIERYYDEDQIITVCGPQGSIIFGDTRCYHKGLKPTKNRRLLLQFNFFSTLIGTNLWQGKKLIIKRNYTQKFLDFVAKHPLAFPDVYYIREK